MRKKILIALIPIISGIFGAAFWGYDSTIAKKIDYIPKKEIEANYCHVMQFSALLDTLKGIDNRLTRMDRRDREMQKAINNINISLRSYIISKGFGEYGQGLCPPICEETTKTKVVQDNVR